MSHFELANIQIVRAIWAPLNGDPYLVTDHLAATTPFASWRGTIGYPLGFETPER